MKVHSVICAYNEEATIAGIVSRTLGQCNEVLVIDDGSRDKTAELAEGAGAIVLRHLKNLGKGAALKTGFKRALEGDGEIIVTLDADGQHLPEEISRLLGKVQEGYDMVIGGRNFSVPSVPFSRRLANTLDSKMLSFALGERVYDAQSGFRAFNRGALWGAYSMMHNSGFTCEPELVARMIKAGYKVGWTDITTVYESGRKSKIKPLKHIVDSVRLYGRCAMMNKTAR